MQYICTQKQKTRINRNIKLKLEHSRHTQHSAAVRSLSLSFSLALSLLLIKRQAHKSTHSYSNHCEFPNSKMLCLTFCGLFATKTFSMLIDFWDFAQLHISLSLSRSVYPFIPFIFSFQSICCWHFDFILFFSVHSK